MSCPPARRSRRQAMIGVVRVKEYRFSGFIGIPVEAIEVK
jgi:hypothetical protein